jgi:hypothetical protein
MARIIIGSWMVRYPLGGNLSWTLQWLVGFQRLGHEVFLVEKSGYPDSCFDPEKGVMSDDCTYGLEVVHTLFARFGLQDSWCYADAQQRYHGMTRVDIESKFRSADVFVDMGTHGAWLNEAAHTGVKVFVDLEPGFRQIKMEKSFAGGEAFSGYDYYYTNGANIGTPHSTAPTGGKKWHHLINPVVVNLFPLERARPDAPFTTIMNWQAHEVVELKGKTYGQKDVEFEKFISLPCLTSAALEIAVAGGNVPEKRLKDFGWRLRNAHEVTTTYDSYRQYIRDSRGEFSVCKNVFVSTNSGWFSDRSAAYLASGRPVVLQDTGFSEHFPCGSGLFAVRTVEEAAAAIDTICHDYEAQSDAARQIAGRHLDAEIVLARFLNELGL